MRKTAFLLLLAAVATPSLAQDRDDDREARREAARAERAERAQAREERQAERPQRVEQQERQQVQVDRRNDGDRAAVREQRREIIQQRQVDRGQDRDLRQRSDRPVLDQRPAIADSVRDWRREQRADRRAERRAPPPVISNVPREGTQPPPRATSERRYGSQHWNGSWRNDRRYDWYNWRHRNRSLFRLGFYFDPFGWGYRPYSIGWRLWPSYYSSRYWLNDPWMYRLPYAPPGTRWIRYYDDALLVDTWSGEVVDVIYSFFW